MSIDPHDAAKRVLIAYRQLSEIAKEPIVGKNVESHLVSYNRILATLNECFAIDPAFVQAVNHLKEQAVVSRAVGSEARLAAHMDSDSKVLLATAHSFIEMYLSPEDKKKTIGFHSS